MGESSCVACGECMISCPTGALTNRSVVKIVMDKEGQIREDEQWQAIARDRQQARCRRSPHKPPARKALGRHLTEPVACWTQTARPSHAATRAAPRSSFARAPSPRQSCKKLHPATYSGDISEQFLDWNDGAVVRRHFKNGEIICREGEFGSTAFIIEQGQRRGLYPQPIKHARSKPPSLLAAAFRPRRSHAGAARRHATSPQRFIHIDAPVALEVRQPGGRPRSAAICIFGEMTCMSHYPRSATVTAQGDCTVLEVLRNVLYILQRDALVARNPATTSTATAPSTSHLRRCELFSQIFQTDRGQFQELRRLRSARVSI